MFDVGAIVGRMVLDTEKWDKAVAQVQMQTKSLSDKTKELAQDWIQSGRSLDRLGNKLAMIGGIGLAPFALAVKNVAKENYALQNQLDQMADSFKGVQRELVGNLVPWIDRLSQVVRNAADSFNKLNPTVKQFAVDFVIITSALTLGGGLLLKVIGLFQILGGAILNAVQALFAFAAANPIIALVIAVGAVVVLFWKFKDSILAVNAALGQTIAYGFIGFFQSVAYWILKATDLLWQLILKIPFLPQAVKDSVNTIRAQTQQMATDMAAKFDESMNKIKDAWSGIIGHVKTKAQEIPTVWSEMLAGMQKGIHDLQIQYNNWGEFMKTKTMEIAQSMEQFFSNFFFDMMTNKFKGFKQTMIDLGQMVLRLIADIIARMLMALAIKAALAPITGGASFLIPGFADGTEEVQSPGLYKLHGGEKITPKYDAGRPDKQSLTIYNLISSEAVALAMQSKAGQGVIVNVVNANSLRNGVIRKEVANR